MEITTTQNNMTVHYDEKGETYIPCRCGSAHRGEYAREDWAHHNCLHGDMLLIADNQCICEFCGASFEVQDCRDGH